MKNNLKYLGLVLLLFIVIFIGAFYSIDLKNMDEGKPVILSTWGRKYSPVESADAEKIKSAINKYIVDSHQDSSFKYNEKWFSTEKVYLISKNDDVYNAYAWVYAASYTKKSGGELLEGNIFSIPYVFTLKHNGDEFIVEQAECPQDATYTEDMEKMFPENVLTNINKANTDGTIEELQMAIQHQVADYYS